MRATQGHAAGKPPLHPRPDLPDYLKHAPGVGAEVDGGGASSTLPVDQAAGSYAFLCYVNDLRQQEIYVAAQLDVTGTPSYP